MVKRRNWRDLVSRPAGTTGTMGWPGASSAVLQLLAVPLLVQELLKATRQRARYEVSSGTLAESAACLARSTAASRRRGSGLVWLAGSPGHRASNAPRGGMPCPDRDGHGSYATTRHFRHGNLQVYYPTRPQRARWRPSWNPGAVVSSQWFLRRPVLDGHVECEVAWCFCSRAAVSG